MIRFFWFVHELWLLNLCVYALSVFAFYLFNAQKAKSDIFHKIV